MKFGTEILEVFVVHPDFKLQFCSLQIVPSCFKTPNDCQHLFVMDFVVLLCSV